MESKSNLRSIIRQVKTTTEGATSKLGFNKRQSSSAASEASITRLDLSSAIEYNRLLINSYLEEKGTRELPLYDRIIRESDDSEAKIIDSVRAEFFLAVGDNIEDNNDCDKSQHECYDEDKILELCVLSRLPPLEPSDQSGTFGTNFLRYLSSEKDILTRQVTIVSKKLSDLIVANETELQTELERIIAIDSQLGKALRTCAQGRSSLKQSKDNFTSTSLSIIDNYRVRQSILKLIEHLQNIKTIRLTIEHIHDQLENEKNFIDALKLYRETWNILETIEPNLHCVEEMKSRLADMLVLAEQRMDCVLAGMPFHFCLEAYEQLCRAYQEIDRSEVLVHQLLLHYSNTIHDKAFAIVHGYVQLFVDLATSATSTPVKSAKKGASAPSHTFESEFQRKPYADLCLFLKPESFLSCLVDLCRALWEVMLNYHRTLAFYKSSAASEFLNQESRAFAITKLEQGLLGVWFDVQTKIRTLVSSVKFVEVNDQAAKIDLDDAEQDCEKKEDDQVDDQELLQQDQLLFTFDEFIKILTVCERMIEVGVQFARLAGDNSDNVVLELQKTLYKQTRAYFQSYHRVSMAELRIFLENETWTRCPIESRCELQLIANLQEFSFIKNRLMRIGKTNIATNDKQTRRNVKTNSSFLLSPSASFNSSGKDHRHFFGEDVDGVLHSSTLFNDVFDSQIDDSYSDGEDEEKSEVEAVCVTRENDHDIIATNTALNVIRLTGRYMHIMYLLRPISHDIIKALLELFDYYFYTVYQFFCIDAHAPQWLAHFLMSSGQTITKSAHESLVNGGGKKLVHELRSFIRRANETLIVNEAKSARNSATVHTCSNNTSPKKVGRYHCPMLPTFLNCDRPEQLFAIAERIMAIESLIFISRQFYHLCSFLLDFLRKDQESGCEGANLEEGFKLLQFYHDQMCSNVENLTYQCLLAVSTKIMPYESVLAAMQQVRWDLDEIPSMHSSYVDKFVHEMANFNEQYLHKLAQADLDCLSNHPHRSVSVEEDGEKKAKEDDEDEVPLVKLARLGSRVSQLLWETIVRVCNRTFVEGFCQSRKCTQEGRALMQLDYQQFLTNVERILLPYFTKLHGSMARARVKTLLAGEKELVEEYIKAYYLTEEGLLEWMRARPEYTARQFTALVHAMTHDNKRGRATLMAAINADLLNTTE